MKTAHATAPTPATPTAQAQAARGRAAGGPAAADAFALDFAADDPAPQGDFLRREASPLAGRGAVDTSQVAIFAAIRSWRNGF